MGEKTRTEVFDLVRSTETNDVERVQARRQMAPPLFVAWLAAS